MAWETIKIPRKSSIDSSEYLAAEASGRNNQGSFAGGPARMRPSVEDVVSNSKTAYGAPTIMPNQVNPDTDINHQADMPTNQFDTDPRQTSGSLTTQSSFGTDTPVDTTELGAGRLEQRLALLKGAGNNVGINLNDPNVYNV